MRKAKQPNTTWHWRDEPEKKSFNWSIVPAYIGLVATAITLYFTSQTFRENEKWKKGEFIANQFEKFNADSNVRFVTNFVDYYSRLVRMPNESDTLLDRDDVADYLFPADLSPDMDSRKRAYVRDRFDGYLDKVSLFNRYETSKLVKLEDIHPYLIYQLELLGKPSVERHLATFQESLWSYIERYGYRDVQQLYCKMGYNIYPESKADSCTCAQPGKINTAMMFSLQQEETSDTETSNKTAD